MTPNTNERSRSWAGMLLSSMVGVCVGGALVAYAADLLVLDDSGATLRLQVRDSGATRIVSNDPAAPALEVTSTAGGFLLPRMTEAQRDAIASPAAGLQVYDTTSNTVDYYDGSQWRRLSAGSSSSTDFEDDFSVYSTQAAADLVWPTSDPAKVRVDIANDELDFEFKIEQNDDDCIVHDLQSDLGVGTFASDSAWVLRFRLSLSTAGGSTNFWGLSSGDQTVGQTAAQDFIGMRRDGAFLYSIDINDTELAAAVDGTVSITWAATTYYVQIRRLSLTTYDVKLFSDSGYSVETHSAAGTTGASVTALRYIKFINRSSFTNPATDIGSVDDVQFWDGVTSPP